MYCPYCRAEDTRVVDSRLVEEGASVRRRRECTVCNERFTTYETAELVMPRIVKSDGSRVDFSEEKIRSGMIKALEKRPVSTEAVDEAVAHIRHEVRNMGEKEIPAECIGDLVMKALRKMDEVAYVRFASVYRSFQDVNEFSAEISKLIKKGAKVKA